MGRLMTLLMAALLVAGCSTHAMKSQPLWGQPKDEDEEKPIEIAFEGTNAWPIYYQRGEEVAVLWPLFAASENGHAVALAYEYLREENTLRILQLFPWLPSYARFQPDRKAWYVVPFFTWQRRDPEKQEHPKPTWRSGDRIVFLFPFYYNSPSTFWTPLFSDQRYTGMRYYAKPEAREEWDEARRVGFLGPLFFHETIKVDGHHRLNAPFPLIAAWWGGRSTGFCAFPLIYQTRKEDGDRHFNLLGLLFHSKATSREVSSRNTDEKDPITLTKRFNFLAWPLLYWGTDVTSEEDLIEMTRKQLMYQYWHKPQEREYEPRTKTVDKVGKTWYRVVLFGLFQHRRKIEMKGSAYFPVWETSPTEWDFTARGRTTMRLFPLFSTTQWDDGDSGTNILWQLYNSFTKTRASGEKYTKRTVLWRLYRHERLGGQSLTDVFPFISTARDQEANRSRWTLAGGLYERRTEDGVRTTKLLWIPVSRRAVSQN